jgi:hypothetical protein
MGAAVLAGMAALLLVFGYLLARRLDVARLEIGAAELSRAAEGR